MAKSTWSLLEMCHIFIWPNASLIARFMWPTWGPPGSCRPQVAPMLAPWILLSGLVWQHPISPLSITDIPALKVQKWHPKSKLPNHKYPSTLGAILVPLATCIMMEHFEIVLKKHLLCWHFRYLYHNHSHNKEWSENLTQWTVSFLCFHHSIIYISHHLNAVILIKFSSMPASKSCNFHTQSSLPFWKLPVQSMMKVSSKCTVEQPTSEENFIKIYFSEARPPTHPPPLPPPPPTHNPISVRQNHAHPHFSEMRPHTHTHIKGILPKWPYPPCLRMADRALLAWYPRYEKFELHHPHTCYTLISHPYSPLSSLHSLICF